MLSEIRQTTPASNYSVARVRWPTSNREPAALIVGQPESPSPELLLEDSVLLSEILNDSVLLAAHPAGQGGNEDLPRLKDGGHRLILSTPRANRQLSAGWQTG